jgi:hypothetical protein
MNKGLLGVITFFSLIIGFTFGLKLGYKIYDNPEVDETLFYLRRMLKDAKG